MLSRIPSGKLTDRIGQKYPLIIAFTLLTAAFLTMSETYNIYLLTFALIIYGAAHGMRAVAEWSMLGDYAPLQAGNVATAYLSTMMNVGAAFGAVIAGTLSIVFSIPSIFKLASIIIFSGVIMAILPRPKSKKKSVHTSGNSLNLSVHRSSLARASMYASKL